MNDRHDHRMYLNDVMARAEQRLAGQLAAQPGIRAGQVYRDCDPRSSVTIRIVTYRPGDARAHVVDAVTGKRYRQILARTLHDSATTKAGQPRRTGYALAQDTEEPQP